MTDWGGRPAVLLVWVCERSVAQCRGWWEGLSEAVANAENFHGVGFGSGSYGGHLHLVCAVCYVTIWRHFHVSKPTFWRGCWHNMHIFLHPLPLFCVVALIINYQRSKLGDRRETNSSLRHSSSQLQTY